MKESKSIILEKFNNFYHSDNIEEKRKIKSEIILKVKEDIKNVNPIYFENLNISLLAHIDTFSQMTIKTPKTAFLNSLEKVYGF